MSPERHDLVLSGGLVIVDAVSTLNPGWVAVNGQRIAAVGAGTPPPAAREVDVGGDIVLPGFVNTHSHAIGAFVRGLGGDVSTRLQMQPMRPTMAIRSVMSHDDTVAAARLAIAEMQLSGVTATADSQLALAGREFQADATLSALAESNMAAHYFRASADRTDLTPAEFHDSPSRAAREYDRLTATWTGERLTIGIEPMALHRTSDTLLDALIALSRDGGAPLAMHGPYAHDVAADARQRFGQSTVRVLADRGALSPRFLLYHPAVLDPGDIDLLGQNGAATAVCAVDNMLIGTEVPPLADLEAAGVRTGLGLDQPNDGHDMFQLMKLTLLASRAASGDPTWPSPADMIHLATAAGAEALDIPAGRLSPGAWADIVVIDGSHPTTKPRSAAQSNLVLACGPQSIRSVYTAGRLTVDRGEHLLWDLPELGEEVDRAMAACRARAGLD